MNENIIPGTAYYLGTGVPCNICGRSVDNVGAMRCTICDVREAVKVLSAGMAVVGLKTESKDMAKFGAVLGVACLLSHLIY